MCDACRDHRDRDDGPTSDLQAWAEMYTGPWGTYDPDDKEPRRDPWADDLLALRAPSAPDDVRPTDRGADLPDASGTSRRRHRRLPVRKTGVTR